MLNIFVIDDEPFVREALVLRSSVVCVVGASDATAKLMLMVESPMDLVIFDLALPGMGGVAAIKSWPPDV